MPSREERTKDINLWQKIDFEKVKQRIHQITAKIEKVQYKYDSPGARKIPYSYEIYKGESEERSNLDVDDPNVNNRDE